VYIDSEYVQLLGSRETGSACPGNFYLSAQKIANRGITSVQLVY